MKLHKINIEDECSLDFIYKINKETALLTAKKDLKVNTMTIAWGSVGFLWYKPIIEVYVRESRYTLEFMESSEYFSVCFFPSEYKDKLIYLGTHSGRDEDKAHLDRMALAFFHASAQDTLETFRGRQGLHRDGT